MKQTNPLRRTRKGINRMLRKHANRTGTNLGRVYLPGDPIPDYMYDGHVTPPAGWVNNGFTPSVVEVINVTPVVKPDPVPVDLPTVFKKYVREADPAKPGSKRRTDYKVWKNPKNDGTPIYVKTDGKWVQVPYTYLTGDRAAA